MESRHSTSRDSGLIYACENTSNSAREVMSSGVATELGTFKANLSRNVGALIANVDQLNNVLAKLQGGPIRHPERSPEKQQENPGELGILHNMNRELDYTNESLFVIIQRLQELI